MDMQHANWISQARSHWQEHLPLMYARLKKAGTLEQALTDAADATAAAMRALTAQGVPQQDAWEQTRETYLFPPEERSVEPKMPPSQGYLAHRDLMQGLSDFDPNKED